MPNSFIEFGNPEAILESVCPPSAASAKLLVTDAVRAGQIDLGLGLLEAIRRRYSEEPATDLMAASILARTGQLTQAQCRLGEMRRSFKTFLIPQIYEAQLLAEFGQRSVAIRMLRDAVARCPDYPGLAGTLAAMMMPGPGYRDVLTYLHRSLTPRGYLEIGVETGATLRLSQARCTVGVDPDFGPLRRDKVPCHFKLYEMKSADFFSNHLPRDVLEKTPLDLVFIDGLHRFEAAVSDFAAIEGWAHEHTVVVMHDALPIAPVYASAERSTRFWVGDVWKTISLLQTTRPELRLRIIATPPSGLLVITKINPKLAQTQDWYLDALGPLRSVELSNDVPPWPEGFPLVSNDPNGYREALGQ